MIGRLAAGRLGGPHHIRVRLAAHGGAGVRKAEHAAGNNTGLLGQGHGSAQAAAPVQQPSAEWPAALCADADTAADGMLTQMVAQQSLPYMDGDAVN